MTEEKNHTSTNSSTTKVEVEVLPNDGKISLSVTCNGSKLTKADSGRFNEFQEEIWASVKSTKCDAGKTPDIEVSVHERCGAKLTKADAGKIA